MTNCKEFFLDDMMAVTAIPVGNIPMTSPSSPACQLTATIAAGTVTTAMLANSITIGRQAEGQNGTLIPIMRLTGKAKDDESDSVAGRLHKVTVTCQVDDRDATVFDSLLRLERTPAHLLLTFRDLSRAFVCGSRDTYLCQVDRDGAKTSVQLRIECLMGIQMMV